MITIRILGLLLLLLADCNNSETGINGSMEEECIERWSVLETQSGFFINYNGESRIKMELCLGCFDTMILDTGNVSMFIIYGDNIALIDCTVDTVYEFQLKSLPFSRINPSFEVINEKYIYSSNGEFYLFNRKLSLLYSSWDFIYSLSDTNFLGLSGVNIQYYLQDDNIVITYDLLSDVHPFNMGILKDTIR